MIDVDSAPRRQQLRFLNSELERQPAGVVQALIDALRSLRAASPDLDREIWGGEPRAAEVRGAAARNLALGIARRDAVLESSLTRSNVADALGKSDQAVSDMLERGALIGLKHGREWRIPAWQMAPDLVEGHLPGLSQLARVWQDGIVSLSEWVQHPSPDLGGATPRQALARGQVAEVLTAARTE